MRNRAGLASHLPAHALPGGRGSERPFRAARASKRLIDFFSSTGLADVHFFFLGIFAPDFRASLRAIAMACFRLFTLWPLPDLRVPCFFSLITLAIFRFPRALEPLLRCAKPHLRLLDFASPGLFQKLSSCRRKYAVKPNHRPRDSASRITPLATARVKDPLTFCTTT